MRSLGQSPTDDELEKYFKEKSKLNYLITPHLFVFVLICTCFCSSFQMAIDGKISFADLLDVMHTHSVKEKIPQEILDAFVATDWARSGQMMTRDLKHILCGWGEKLIPKEFEQLLKEANISGPYFKYEDFVKIISAPIPDYWSTVHSIHIVITELTDQLTILDLISILNYIFLLSIRNLYIDR